MKWAKSMLYALGVGSLALAAPFTYTVIKDGAPSNFEKQIAGAFDAWKKVPSTNLKVETRPNADVQFRWGAGDIELNPDLNTRTIIETDASGKTITTVSVNPETQDLESTLLVEAGLRLGLALEPSIEGKRTVGPTEIALLRKSFAQNGDMNNDGKVDVQDLELFAAQFGKVAATPGAALAGDFNGDGRVEDKDLEILRTAYDFGGDVGVEPAAPKPATTPAPTAPATPNAPANPAAPANPTAPTNPAAPANPAPANPTAPTNPATPTNPPPAPTAPPTPTNPTTPPK
jgi:hypothetical protein